MKPHKVLKIILQISNVCRLNFSLKIVNRCYNHKKAPKPNYSYLDQLHSETDSQAPAIKKGQTQLQQCFLRFPQQISHRYKPPNPDFSDNTIGFYTKLKTFPFVLSGHRRVMVRTSLNKFQGIFQNTKNLKKSSFFFSFWDFEEPFIQNK